MIKNSFQLIARKIKLWMNKNITTRLETLRMIYQNRKNAITTEKNNISRAHLIFNSQAEINEKARSWAHDENEEKYITNALLEWEFMSTIKAEDRKLIEKGARLREQLMTECAQLSQK